MGELVREGNMFRLRFKRRWKSKNMNFVLGLFFFWEVQLVLEEVVKRLRGLLVFLRFLKSQKSKRWSLGFIRGGRRQIC